MESPGGTAEGNRALCRNSVDTPLPGETIGVMATISGDDTTPAVEDESLVRSVLGGDGRAFGRLYDRYAPVIRAVCYDMTGDIAEGEDLCQQTFLQAYQGLRRLRKPERFAAWLVQIARYTCLDWRRLRGRVRGIAAANSETIPQTGPPEPANSDELGLLHGWLRQLPEKERLAIQVHYLLEQPVDRARAILKMSRPGLYRVLDRAMKRLRRLAKGHFGEESHGR
jgi:RNA polymerase sigma-70 factor, ECF subfamily